MTDETPPDDPEESNTPYDVGYGKPPKASRFQPGRSGNPRGRPKGSRKKRPADAVKEQLNALMLEEAYRAIQVRDGDTLVEMSIIQAAFRTAALKAVKGDLRSQRMLFDAVGNIENERRKQRQAFFEAAVDYQINGRAENALARSRGLPEPIACPHPDDLIIDPVRGSVMLRGPFTPEEKVEWDSRRELRAQSEARIAELEAEVRTGSRRTGLREAIDANRSIIAKIDVFLAERVLLAEGD